ncbi:Dpy-30 motif protein (macronuclear) [Tetrahymena thermophila SB210]|uniref:Dpy-30 motif protein n=1 Tax=Tetrahymena thermophila (strain SB210) TaxID=312017 RepID=I7MLH8_TETTS|nr:Dpy-30 motif protein [Tetrahymena thermophila SB210]EAS02125.2 Dpy-30 motif protein [Tetrahymena thermophila SB210]|eukprot:XP_001022370.2 Dpy-30 motif protein [Tetrahymena thermophila SB210]
MTESVTTRKTAQKKEPLVQKRFFISSLNTLVGQALVESLRNDHINDENPHFIVGSLSPHDQSDVPRGVFRVIDTSKLTFLSKVILDSDVIIYDLNSCDLEEAEFAIKTLKMGEYKDEKILIFISSVMVWSNTPLREKKENDEIREEDGLEEPQSDNEDEAQNAGGDDEEVQKKVYLRYTEKEYTQRKPLPKYEVLKSLETMCIAAGNAKQNLRSYVLCSGIQYGNGEQVFYDHFQSAWLQDPEELIVVGDGKNRIPTIHVRDLAMFAKKIVDKPPNQSYIFAIDHNQKPTQLSLVQAISKGLGTGKVKHIDLAQAALSNNNFDIFSLDVRLRPSRVFDLTAEEEEQQQEDDEQDGVDKPPKGPEWHCKEGLIQNIAKLNKEFNDFNGLKPNRIFLAGPPASGKTYYGEKLAKHYNIPHILIKHVVEQFLKVNEAAKEEFENLKQTQVDAARTVFEAELKKKKPKKGEPVPVFDENAVVIRLPDTMLFQAFQWRLKQTDCQNRGYVLDGYPKTFAQAQGVFLKSKLADGEEDNENAEKIIDDTLIPESVVFFQASDEFLKQRVKELPEEKVAGTHYNEEGMNRRLADYRKHNEQNTGEPILFDFFKQNQIDPLIINSQNHDNEPFDNLRSFIERNGNFKNYQIHDDVQEIEREQDLNEQLEEQRKREQAEEQARNEKEEEQRRLQEEDYRLKMEKIKNQERDKLDERSQSLRQYLADNVVPFLTEGLIELCKTHPEDPVDQLAEYLFKRSLEVQFPDPSSYNPY